MDGFMENIREAFADWWLALSESAPQAIIALLILVIGIYAARVFSSLAQRGLRYRKADAEITVVLGRIVQWSIIVLGLLMAAQYTGLDITAFLAGLGIIGFTVGFALQDVSKNFVAGMLILIQQPFELGDTIQVSGFTGTVLEINLRDTEMRTGDGLRVRIPNGDVFTSPIINYTGAPKRRLQLRFGVAYDSDLDQVRQMSLEALASVKGVLQDPAIDFRFEAFGDYSIQVKVLYWYDESQTSYSEALDGGMRKLKAAFDQAGIKIPAPHQTIKLAATDKTEPLSD